MAKPFDAASKQLIELDPLAWLHYVGLPGTQAELIDADLSAVTSAADRLLYVKDPPYLVHIEMQASHDEKLDSRTLGYSVPAHIRFLLPVVSLIVLMRREAERKPLSGIYTHTAPGYSEPTLTFRYHVVRLWELAPETLLNGSLALLPYVPLTNVSRKELPQIMQRMEARLTAEALPEDRRLLWVTTNLLLGLKFKPDFVANLLKGVQDLKESSTYQAILKEGHTEGLAEGRVEGEQHLIRIIGEQRFGKPDSKMQNALNKITSPEQLEALAKRLFEVESWQELLH